MTENAVKSSERFRETEICLKLCWLELSESSEKVTKKLLACTIKEINSFPVLDGDFWQCFSVCGFWLLDALLAIFKGPWSKSKTRNPVPKQREFSEIWELKEIEG